MKYFKKHEGFTLIELSIVLVVIGLLAGGVLAGQELMRAARINKLISEISKYKTAVYTFKLKYNAVPGDMADATTYFPSCVTDPADATNVCDGNGNGKIDASREPFRFWQHLSLAGLVEGKYTGYFSGAVFYDRGINVAPSLIRETAFYQVLDCSPTTGFTLCAALSGYPFGIMTPADTYRMDKKIDDGLPGRNENTGAFPYQGNVIGWTGYATTSYGAYATKCTVPTDTPPQYNITSQEVNCYITTNLQ